MSTTQRSPMSIFSIGSLRGSVSESGAYRAGRVVPVRRGSRIRNDLQAPLFQAISQAAECIDQLIELLVAEFGKNELVKRFLLGGKPCHLLVGLVGQRHQHDSGVFGRCLAAKETLLLQEF